MFSVFFSVLSLWNHIFVFFPCSFSLFFLSFLSLSYRFYLRHFCHDLFMAHYTFGLRFFCQSFERLVCPHSLLHFFFMLFYSLLYICCCSCCCLKNIDFLHRLFSSSLQFFSATLIFFYQLVLLELYSFPLICPICLHFSSLFFFAFISHLYDRLSTFVFISFPYSSLFLIVLPLLVSIVSPFFFYRFLLLSFFPSYFSCSEVYSLFLSYQFALVCS